MIDYYDSFVYNLVSYLEELGKELEVIKWDKLDFDYLESLNDKGQLTGIILSPGPGRPSDYDKSLELIGAFGATIPILGVCLGHQIIGHFFGANIGKGKRPMHGKVTTIKSNGYGLFTGLPESFNVTRYHSLVVEIPEEAPLKVDAISEDKEVMAMHHCKKHIYGIQFHPEAVLTEHGHALLNNFCEICEENR